MAVYINFSYLLIPNAISLYLLKYFWKRNTVFCIRYRILDVKRGLFVLFYFTLFYFNDLSSV